MSLAERAAYANGVIAAGHALLADLEHLGVLDDSENHGHDGYVCAPCSMRRFGYTSLATRTEFAHNVAMEDA